ncbi:unnamed protein product, partial [Cyprideis torosa]
LSRAVEELDSESPDLNSLRKNIQYAAAVLESVYINDCRKNSILNAMNSMSPDDDERPTTGERVLGNA